MIEIETFDILRVEDSGQRVWQAATLTRYDGIMRVKQLAAPCSGEYFIRCPQSNVDISVTVNPQANERPQFIVRSKPAAHAEKGESSSRRVATPTASATTISRSMSNESELVPSMRRHYV
jgi:hypothetical protein